MVVAEELLERGKPLTLSFVDRSMAMRIMRPSSSANISKQLHSCEVIFLSIDMANWSLSDSRHYSGATSLKVFKQLKENRAKDKGPK